MSRITFNRKRVKLKKVLGIRARLALLALILVAPLMLERARSLEDARTNQIAHASQEFQNIAQHTVQAQREVISSVETMMKSAAYIRASAGGVSRSCDILRASLQVELPWIKSISIVGGNGRVQCSTFSELVGLYLGDRGYFKKAVQTAAVVFSDYIFARASRLPIMTAAYPVSAIAASEDAVIVAAMNLDWMSKIMNNFVGGHPGISAVLVDSAGVVMARARGPGQPDRPLAGYRAALVRHRRQGDRFGPAGWIAFVRRRRRLETRPQLHAHCRHRSAPDRQHR